MLGPSLRMQKKLEYPPPPWEHTLHMETYEGADQNIYFSTTRTIIAAHAHFNSLTTQVDTELSVI